MRLSILIFLICLGCLEDNSLSADERLLQQHCARCHQGKDASGDFRLEDLGDAPTSKSNVKQWETCIDYVIAEEMPPAEESQLTPKDRKRLVAYLEGKVQQFSGQSSTGVWTTARRMNNREFKNSIRDVLLIEDIGTHLPADNLLGDTLHHGFDTHGNSLGFSRFHLEQYIHSVRQIVNATILSEEKPPSRKLEFNPTEIVEAQLSQNTKRRERRGERDGFDFLDPNRVAYLKGFETVPSTGNYRITIRCIGKDRGRYDWRETGVYDDDPIRLAMIMGDRKRIVDLRDEQIQAIELNEWLAAGTQFRMQHPTDGLRLRSNGNFKFQNAITGNYLKQHDPKLYNQVVTNMKPRVNGRKRRPTDWQNWVDYWMGPRPKILSVVVEGPTFDSWPPKRQVQLLGENPRAEHALSILKPIASRAWRREVEDQELAPIVKLVNAQQTKLGDIEALKEGIIAILASPQFLLLNQPELSAADRFASKFNYFLESTLPSPKFRERVASGQLESFESIRAEVKKRLTRPQGEVFLRAFPYAWLELNDINFMAPDPDQFRHYHRKRVSEDMIDEALHFFRHAVNENIPLTEFLSANYSFVNADLAVVYGLDDVPLDSEFRKYTFNDGKRGGLLGMGAFLTVSADSLGTSPIHRAIYVMENFLDIHPSPPPADVNIEEPDVRSARTIREVLEAHRSDKTCAACHRLIDPYGYAFENFDSMGAWREKYAVASQGNPKSKRTRSKNKTSGIEIDASAQFASGARYSDIVEFRKLMKRKANQERFVRCFVRKLLTYANGVEPDNYVEIKNIVEVSRQHDFRIVDTIAAVIDSPLFREKSN